MSCMYGEVTRAILEALARGPMAEAVEVYPPAGDVVNVANMRHLWVLSEQLPFAWRKGRQ